MIHLLAVVACVDAGSPTGTGTPGPTVTTTSGSDTHVTTPPTASELNGTYPPSPVGPPTFDAVYNRDGTPRSPAALLGQPTVLWFYPAAGSAGWTIEGCGYRNLYDDFTALGIQIVGTSFDTPPENDAWAVEEGFQFELWSDVERQLGLYYGATDSVTDLKATRLTKLLDADGNLVLEYVDRIDTGVHPSEVLADCTLLFPQ